MTDAENVLWDLLKNRKFKNTKFRRQHPIGSFIADFYCHEEKLVIELDGKHHLNDQSVIAYDKKRTAFFNKRGLKVIRFENMLVIEQSSYVLNEISKAFNRSDR